MDTPRNTMYRALDTLRLLEKLLDPHEPLDMPERAELALLLLDLLRNIQAGIDDLEERQVPTRPCHGGEEVPLP